MQVERPAYKWLGDGLTESSVFYVYVLQDQAKSDRFYVGYSSDLKRRFKEHNDGLNASTRGRQWRLVYYEAYATKRAAQERERVLKGDGRSRRHLMGRIRTMLEQEIVVREPFIGGERQTGE